MRFLFASANRFLSSDKNSSKKLNIKDQGVLLLILTRQEFLLMMDKALSMASFRTFHDGSESSVINGQRLEVISFRGMASSTST